MLSYAALAFLQEISSDKLFSLPLQRALIDRLTKESFEIFLRRAFETVVPGEKLHLNWHILAIAHVFGLHPVSLTPA